MSSLQIPAEIKGNVISVIPLAKGIFGVISNARSRSPLGNEGVYRADILTDGGESTAYHFFDSIDDAETALLLVADLLKNCFENPKFAAALRDLMKADKSHNSTTMLF